MSAAIPHRALAQDTESPLAATDSLVLPAYSTTYDRDRSRELWSQDLSYGVSNKRSYFNLLGAIDTQNFLKSASKSTNGSINGTLAAPFFPAIGLPGAGFPSSVSRRIFPSA